LLPRFVLFRFGGPSSSAWSGGAISGTGCTVSQPFAVVGNQSYPEFWAVTDVPWYPGYKTPTVVSEPSVERVAKADHSTVDRTCTHSSVRL
jgi:hypothetical protein